MDVCHTGQCGHIAERAALRLARDGSWCASCSIVRLVTSLDELARAVPEQWRCAAKLQRARARSSALVERHGLGDYEGGRYLRTFESLIASVEAGLARGEAPRVDRDEVQTLIRLFQVDRLGPGDGEAMVLLRWLAIQSGVIPD